MPACVRDYRVVNIGKNSKRFTDLFWPQHRLDTCSTYLYCMYCSANSCLFTHLELFWATCWILTRLYSLFCCYPDPEGNHLFLASSFDCFLLIWSLIVLFIVWLMELLAPLWEILTATIVKGRLPVTVADVFIAHLNSKRSLNQERTSSPWWQSSRVPLFYLA